MSDSYSQDDVQQILQRAIARRTEDSPTDTFSRQQLLEMADELGILPQDLEQAETEWLTIQKSTQEHQEFQVYRRGQFRSHLVRYLTVNGFLVALDWVIAPGFSFAQYVLLGWGLGLSLDGWTTFQPESERYQKDFQKWKQKQQFQQFKQELGENVVGYLRRFFKDNQ